MQSILEKPRVAVAMGKALVYRQRELGLDAAYQLAGQTMAVNMMDEAAQEGRPRLCRETQAGLEVLMFGKGQPVLSGGVDAWLLAFTQPTVLIELGVLALCALLAWAWEALLRRGVRTNDASSILFGRRVVDGVCFRWWLASAYVARTLLQQWRRWRRLPWPSRCWRHWW